MVPVHNADNFILPPLPEDKTAGLKRPLGVS